ncbi:molecular chaperone DnaJ [Actinoplanes sp. NPDC051851]|uniref:molecular chaperone DnaJ n=1 Tax=Actinoplanes sp. NPDC051851 TaxID=3154753 RepID=UPI00342A4A05
MRQSSASTGVTFEEAAARIAAASSFAELTIEGTPGRAGSAYRTWAKLVHPDTVTDAQRDSATQAMARLAELYQRRGAEPAVSTPDRARRVRRYRRGPLVARGDLADLYESGDVLLKVARDAGDNDLMAAEANALRRLRSHGDPRYRAYAPRLVESFQDERRHAVNVLARQRGFRSLAEEGTPRDPVTAVGVWRRLLTGLGWAHAAGVVHGAVFEEHVLIHPGHRGLVLVDWCYSGRRPKAIIAAREAEYPPEVLEERVATPATDIYLATNLMLRLFGANLPAPLRRFADGCAYPARRMRPQDAWRLLAELDELIPQRYRN